jgi:L-alanine-DL-glutamate epimerase-like enolase superfamily enzyme
LNIRVSKSGGFLNSMRIARNAADAGIFCIVGAQVGESGILSAAGRHLAACIAPRYVEGSAGRLLLKRDLTVENVMPGWKGRARTFKGYGLGIRVREDVLRASGSSVRTFVAREAPVSAGGQQR